MAQLQSNLNNSSSSRYGEAAARPADVLASCYVIDDSAALLKGLHYCTTPAAGKSSFSVLASLVESTLLVHDSLASLVVHSLTLFQGQSGIPEVPSGGLPSPPSSPPLAAISATNELTVFPKNKSGSRTNGEHRPTGRGGATLRIREECERLFCETMKTVFLGERNMASTGSSLTGVYNRVPTTYGGHADYDDITPPEENHFGRRRTSSVSVADSSISRSFGSSVGAQSFSTVASSVDFDFENQGAPYAVPSAWLELWDFVGCGSFRGFLAEDPAGETSLFAFFDASVLSRDLKKALMALIELADTALGCAHLVICVDRGGAEALPDEAATLLKGLQWAGFSLTTLDTWTGGSCVDVTSSRWIFMGMEL